MSAYTPRFNGLKLVQCWPYLWPNYNKISRKCLFIWLWYHNVIIRINCKALIGSLSRFPFLHVLDIHDGDICYTASYVLHYPVKLAINLYSIIILEPKQYGLK